MLCRKWLLIEKTLCKNLVLIQKIIMVKNKWKNLTLNQCWISKIIYKEISLKKQLLQQLKIHMLKLKLKMKTMKMIKLPNHLKLKLVYLLFLQLKKLKSIQTKIIN